MISLVHLLVMIVLLPIKIRTILFILLGYSARPIGYMPKKSYICEFSLARRVNKCIVPKHNKLENYLAISRLPKIVATLSSSVL